jgi:hypothetical protein
MGMLAALVARPGEELHALELSTGHSESNEAIDAGDSGELLDETARRAYRRRGQQLAEDLEEAEARGDVRGAEAARVELEALARELSRAEGLGGKARRAGSAAERARVAVQRRIREAIRRIGQFDAALGAHFEMCIRTGTFCSYEPLRDRSASR